MGLMDFLDAGAPLQAAPFLTPSYHFINVEILGRTFTHVLCTNRTLHLSTGNQC